ncbi:hypothetical protein RSOL_406340, partial [Rhizoctonia solani AG-3 Rhs1AP]
MPELMNKRLAADPISTQGTTDGHYEELPKPQVTIEEMLAAVKAKKAAEVDVGAQPVVAQKRKGEQTTLESKDDRDPLKCRGKKAKK